jgi:hypothetical protein
MELKAEISLSVNIDNGNIELGVKDGTIWPVDGNNRSSFYIGFYAYKISVNNNVNPPLVSSTTLSFAGSYQNIVESSDDSESGVRFLVGEDGYHKIYMVAFPKTASNTDGDFYYDGEKILYRESGSYVQKTFDQLLSLSAIPSDYIFDFPVNSRISIELDRISEKYSKGRSGSSDSDYKKWIQLYVMLYGALLSFGKGAYLEYERKVRAANSLF